MTDALTTEFNRAAVVFSLQSWLGESEDSKKGNSTPGYFGVAMSRASLPPPVDGFLLLQ